MDKALMTDAELIHLVRNGDSSCLSFVYEKFRKEYLGWMRKFNHSDDEDAREYYQATVLIFYENVMTGKLGELQSSLKTYLFGIGKNLARKNHQKDSRYRQAKAEYLLEYHIIHDQQDEELKDFNLELVSHCFKSIGDPCHSLLDLFYFHQKNMEEIAVEMGYKNAETAKNQKYKCMERLRKIVQDERTANMSV